MPKGRVTGTNLTNPSKLPYLLSGGVLHPPCFDDVFVWHRGVVVGGKYVKDYSRGVTRYDLTMFGAPCLTIGTGITLTYPGHGTMLSYEGTSTATYDGTTISGTAGTFYHAVFSDGSILPCIGKTDTVNPETIFDNLGNPAIINASDYVAVWAGTQGTYFWEMPSGYSKRNNYITWSEDFRTGWVIGGDGVITVYDGYQNIINTSSTGTITHFSIPATDTELVAIVTWRPNSVISNKLTAIGTGINESTSDYLPHDRFSTMRLDIGLVDVTLALYIGNALTTPGLNVDIQEVRLEEKITSNFYNNGDSTAKTAFGSAGGSSWNVCFGLYLTANEVEGVNAAVGGETLSEISARVVSDLSGESYYASSIGGGINTILNAVADPVPSMIVDAAAMVVAAKAASTIVSLFNVADCPGFTSEQRGWAISYNSGIESVYSNDQQVNIVSVFDLLDVDDFYTDDIHPNIEGHVKLFNYLNLLVPIPDSIETYGYAKTEDYIVEGRQPTPADYPGNTWNDPMSSFAFSTPGTPAPAEIVSMDAVHQLFTDGAGNSVAVTQADILTGSNAANDQYRFGSTDGKPIEFWAYETPQTGLCLAMANIHAGLGEWLINEVTGEYVLEDSTGEKIYVSY